MDNKLELVRAAEKKIKVKNFTEALGDLARCLELYPNFTVAKVLKAECLYYLGKYGEALEILNDVLFSSPDNIKARKLAVECLIETGDIEEARSHIDFLTFLLPPGDAFFDEVEEKINNRSISSEKEYSQSFEIERSEHVEQVEKTEENVYIEHSQSQINDVEKNEVGSEGVVGIQEETDEAIQEKYEESDNEVVDDSNLEKQQFVAEEDAAEPEHTEEIPGEQLYEQSADKKDNISEEKVETVGEENLVTGVIPEQISTVTLPDKREEPEIKTRTLALIYERQGMLEESLEILEELFEETKDVSLLNDIERIKTKMKGDDKKSFVLLKIKKLENWLERIKWNSNN